MLNRDIVIKKLWKIIADIGAQSDISKDDDKCYRENVTKLVNKRFDLGVHIVDGTVVLVTDISNLVLLYQSKDNDDFICAVDGYLCDKLNNYYSNMNESDVWYRMESITATDASNGTMVRRDHSEVQSTYNVPIYDADSIHIKYLSDIGLI